MVGLSVCLSRIWVDEKDHVNVITQTVSQHWFLSSVTELQADGAFVFFNQSKYGLVGWSLAPPSGVRQMHAIRCVNG